MKTGLIGTIVVALCCFTPILVVLLGAVGLSAWLGWIDFVLFPALGFFHRTDCLRRMASAEIPSNATRWMNNGR
jgi:mercuric ion transport protein